jgi:hypothetical protein
MEAVIFLDLLVNELPGGAGADDQGVDILMAVVEIPP